MKARKIVTFLTALMLTTNALAPFPAVVAEGVGAEETATEASATDTLAETAAMDPTEAIDVTEAPAQDATETQAEEKSEVTEAIAGKETASPTENATVSSTDTVKLISSDKYDDQFEETRTTTVTTFRYETAPYQIPAPYTNVRYIRYITDTAVLNVPYSYLSFSDAFLSDNDVPQSTESSTTTESTSTSVTTSTTQKAETIVTTETTDAASNELSGKLMRNGDTCRFTMMYDGESFVAKRDSIRYAPLVDSEHHLRFTADTWVTDVPATCQDTSTNEVLPITEVDITNSWWFKITLGDISIPSGMNIIYNGDVISFEKAYEMLLPVGNTLKIGDNSYAAAAAPSISENLEVSAMGGYPNDDRTPTYRVKEGKSTTADNAEISEEMKKSFRSIAEKPVISNDSWEASMIGFDVDVIDDYPVYYTMPDGLEYYPESSELYGVPRKAGTYIFTVSSSTPNSEGGVDEYIYNYTLTVKANTNLNVYSESDYSYSLLDPIGKDVGGHDYVLEAPMDSVFRSEGKYDQFVRLWLNGEPLELGKDYIAEEGSTKATIFEETFEKKANQNGINTIAAEFRVNDKKKLNDIGDHNPLRVTAQNFHFPNATNTPTVTPYHPSGSNGTPNPHVEPSPAPVNLVNAVPAAQNTSSGTTTTTTVSNSTANPSVATGDTRPYWLYVSAALVGLLGIFTTFPRRKTKTGEEQ